MKTMRTIEHKNIPSRGDQVLIQVQLIQSLPFVTTTKKNKNTTTKIPNPFFNTGCPQGIPRKYNWSGTLKNIRVSISCKLSAIFSVLFLANGKYSLSVKTQFLRRKLPNCHHLYFRVELFFRFSASKGIISFLKMSHLNPKHAYRMATISKAFFSS